MPCRTCGVDVAPRVTWQMFRGGGLHLRADCRVCGRHIRYLPQTPDNALLAESAPPDPDDEPSLFGGDECE